MFAWYKYLPLNYAEEMVEKGNVRIGTLYECRDNESLGADIVDKDEGKLKEWSHEVGPKLGSDLNPFEKKLINAPSMTFLNLSAEVMNNSTNVYLYCVSRCFDTSIMKKMNDTYDSCVEIIDPTMFVEKVKDALPDKAEFLGCADCQYMSRRQHYAANSPQPAIIKDTRFEYQKEVRLMWNPISLNEELCFKIINIEGLRDICKIIYPRHKNA